MGDAALDTEAMAVIEQVAFEQDAKVTAYQKNYRVEQNHIWFSEDNDTYSLPESVQRLPHHFHRNFATALAAAKELTRVPHQGSWTLPEKFSANTLRGRFDKAQVVNTNGQIIDVI